MNGLLLRLMDRAFSSPGKSFWMLFGAVRTDLDRMSWCFVSQPWMGAPEGFAEDESVFAPFAGEGETSVQLWRPGALSRYAEWFTEEYVELFGVNAPMAAASELAARFSVSPEPSDDFIIRLADVWLNYTDSTCWEVYAKNQDLIERVHEGVRNLAWVQVHRGRADARGETYRRAGLSEVWTSLQGEWPEGLR